jgi:hypothetical protein
VATNVTTELPEGFVLDAQVPSYRTEKEMLAAMRLSPDEAAADAADEANPKNDRYLAQEIARTTDPAKLAILQTEQADRSAKYGGGGRFVNASATTSTGLPEGFVLDAPTPAKPLSLYDHMNTPLKVGSAVAGGDKFDATVGTLPYLLNAAKKGVMAIPGLPGDLVAIAKSLGMSNDALSAAGPVGQALAYIGQEQDKVAKGKQPFLTGGYLAEQLLGADAEMKAPNKTTELAGNVTSFVASVPGGVVKAGITGGVVPAAKAFAKLTGLGAAVTAGGEAGQATFGEGPLAKTAGELAILPLLAIGTRSLSLLTKEGRDIASGMASGASKDVGGVVTPFVQRSVENRLAQGVRDFAPAEANIAEAEALRSKISGVNLTAGQTTNAPGVLADELAARRSSNAAVSSALQQDRNNADAILKYVKNGVAPVETTGDKAISDLVTAHNARLNTLVQQADIDRERAAQILSMAKEPKATADLAKLEAEAKAIVPQTPRMTPEQRGMTLTRQQVLEKEREDAITNGLYGAAGSEAKRVNASFSQDAINLAARRLSADPILAYDENNLPGVVRAIRVASNPKGDVVPPSLLERGMNAPIEAEMDQAVPRLSYEQIGAMRTAVNQDISAELASTNANKNQRIRALMDMKSTIDGAIAESEYPSVAKLYRAATEYYRNTYSPKFNQGINSKLMMRDSYGNQKVFSEKILDQYTANVTNANAFVKLFGQNPEALATMEDHLLAKFARPSNMGGVVKDGVIDLKAYDTFIKRNGEVLNTLADAGLPSLKQFGGYAAQRQGIVNRVAEVQAKAAADQLAQQRLAQQLADRAGAYTNYEKEIAQSELGRLLKTNSYTDIVNTAMKSPEAMTRLTGALGEKGSKALSSSVMRDLTEKLTYAPETGKIGLNNNLFNKWLQDNSKSASIMFKAAYGPEEGAAHLQRLKDSSRMLAIMDRAPTPSMAAADVRIGKDPLQERVGVTIRSLFNIGRAIIAGRTSEADAAVLLTGQVMSNVMAKEYNKLMQSVASDPESSKYLIAMLRNGAQSPGNKEAAIGTARAMSSLLTKIGYYYLGGRYYTPTMLKIAPTSIQDATQRQN